jgi:hypothetical protein
MVTETYKLIRTVKKMYPVMQFFKDRYFPDGQVYYSEKALIETKNKGRKIAPFVVPVVGGIVMDSEGYRAREIKAPYIAPKMPITADELEKKAFGESPESGRTPEQRENEIEAEHIDDLRNAIYRRHENMCTSIITDGRVVMKHYASAEDAAKDLNPDVQILQFYEDRFENRYEFSKAFDEMTVSEKIMEFYKIATILKKRGFRATDMVMTADVSMKFMTDEKFLDFYDKAKVNIGSIDPKELPDGVVYNGSININGIVMSMFTYDNDFEDLDGEIKEMLPAGTIAFLHPNIGETVYAQVTFVNNGSFKSYAEKIVPRTMADEKNNMVEVQMFSRPVPYPFHWDSWLVANIYDGTSEKTEKSSVSDSDTSEIELKTTEEIEAMTTKAPLIAYGKSIGMTDDDVNTDMTVQELKTAIIDYQDENYPDDEE